MPFSLQDNPLESTVVVTLCALLMVMAYRKRVLDRAGSAGAFLVGFCVGYFGGINWLLVLLFFLFASFAVTKYKYAAKVDKGVQEDKAGMRGISNVFYNGGVPMAVALLNGLFDHAEVAFAAAIATAASDTFASEIGVFDRRVYLITNFRRVPVGVDGGVSPLGTGAALLGAFLVAWVSATTIFLIQGDPVSLILCKSLVVATAGFIGCQIDSVLGATLERAGYLKKGGVNFYSIAAGAAIAWVLTGMIC